MLVLTIYSIFRGTMNYFVVRIVFLQTNEAFGEELEADILAEGEKLGPVEKITVFPKNFKGPVVIKVNRFYWLIRLVGRK